MTCVPAMVPLAAGEAGVGDEGDELALVLASRSDSPGLRHFLLFTPHVRPLAQSAINTNFVLYTTAYCRAASITSCQLSRSQSRA